MVEIEELFDFLQEFYSPEEYPALLSQYQLWRTEKPLKNLRIADGTPAFHNTLCKYLALLAAGADLTVMLGDQVPYDPELPGILQALGIATAVSGDPEAGDFDVVLDCAGANCQLSSRYGYVELTKSGAAYYQDCLKPVYLADQSFIKEIETSLGTGNGFMRAMAQLGMDDWSGRKVTLLGYGKVGRGMAKFLQQAGADLTVIDQKESQKVPEALHLVPAGDAEAVLAACTTCDYLLTATGVKGALTQICPIAPVIASGAKLVNMGVEDEFGPEVPPERAVNGKRPVNFILSEPTLLRYIDPSLALHNFGAELLKTQALRPGLNQPIMEHQEGFLAAVNKAGLIADELSWLESAKNE